MDDYRLTNQALDDLEGIRRYLQETDSIAAADHVEAALFEAFDQLVASRALGHRRFDVPQEHLLFHNVFQYAVAFYREPRLVIVRVVHGKRDLKRLF